MNTPRAQFVALRPGGTHDGSILAGLQASLNVALRPIMLWGRAPNRRGFNGLTNRPSS